MNHSTNGNAVFTLLLFFSVAKAMVKNDLSDASQYPSPFPRGLFGPHLAHRGDPLGQVVWLFTAWTTDFKT
jgi:hypothetical protein